MGSGKTTAADMLRKRLGSSCEIVYGDSFNQEAVKSLLEEGIVEQILGIPFNPNTWKEDIVKLSEASPEGKEKVSHLTALCDQRVGEFVAVEVDRIKQESSAESIIVEHRGAVHFDMWDKADKRIIVDVDEKARIERLINREFKVFMGDNPNPSPEDFRKFEVGVRSLLIASPDATKTAADKMLKNGEGSGIIRNNGTELEYEFAIEKCIDNYMQEKTTGQKVEQQAGCEPTPEPFNRDELITSTIESFREKFNEKQQAAETLQIPTIVTNISDNK